MKLIDEELRASLHEHADRLAPPLDVFTRVEAKAHRIKRNRMTASVAGAVAAVAAIAIVVPTLTSGPSHHRVGPAGQGGTSTASSGPTQTPPPATDKNALDPAAPWAYRGDQKAITPATLEKFRQDWAAKHPGSTLQPLWGDGHHTGYHTYMLLRDRCPCDVCSRDRASRHETHASSPASPATGAGDRHWHGGDR